MEGNSPQADRMLEHDDGADRLNGDHHTFKHPGGTRSVTVNSHEQRLPPGSCADFTSSRAGARDRNTRNFRSHVEHFGRFGKRS